MRQCIKCGSPAGQGWAECFCGCRLPPEQQRELPIEGISELKLVQKEKKT